MTALKSEIYTNDFFNSFKKIFLPKFKKTNLTYCKLFDKYISKVELRPKSSALEIRKDFLCKRKDHFWSLFVFRNKFYVGTQNVI